MERTSQAFMELRQRMVKQQIVSRGIVDDCVLEAMRRVPRHEFVPARQQCHAYEDRPLSIGKGQTISQPYIVGLMSQLVSPDRQTRVLDVGTGCGYQAAVLAEICGHVESVEIIAELAESASYRLDKLGYSNVSVHVSDAWDGLPGKAPFDAIVVAAAPFQVPMALIEQLAPEGRLVIPVGVESQDLLLIRKHRNGQVETQRICPVAFVPMIRVRN